MPFGVRHPDPIVETASLGSVAPPDIWYKLKLPNKLINTGQLSALQLEAVVYASQQHDQRLSSGCRAGYLIGKTLRSSDADCFCTTLRYGNCG